MIQQLQDEIHRLQLQLKGVEHLGLESSGRSISQGAPGTLGNLQQKLRMAAKHISQLAKEKQQLIEMGNRLRAELNRNGMSLINFYITFYFVNYFKLDSVFKRINMNSQ